MIDTEPPDPNIPPSNKQRDEIIGKYANEMASMRDDGNEKMPGKERKKTPLSDQKKAAIRRSNGEKKPSSKGLDHKWPVS